MHRGPSAQQRGERARRGRCLRHRPRPRRDCAGELLSPAAPWGTAACDWPLDALVSVVLVESAASPGATAMPAAVLRARRLARAGWWWLRLLMPVARAAARRRARRAAADAAATDAAVAPERHTRETEAAACCRSTLLRPWRAASARRRSLCQKEPPRQRVFCFFRLSEGDPDSTMEMAATAGKPRQQGIEQVAQRWCTEAALCQ